MAITEKQMTGYVAECAKMDLSTACVEFRAIIAERVDTPILNKNGKNTGRVHTEIRTRPVNFRVVDLKVVRPIADAIKNRAVDTGKVIPGASLVAGLFDPAKLSGEKIRGAGFTLSNCTIFAAVDGTICHMNAGELVKKLAVANKVATALGGWEDDKARVDYRATSLRDGEGLTAGGVEFIDLSNR